MIPKHLLVFTCLLVSVSLQSHAQTTTVTSGSEVPLSSENSMMVPQRNFIKLNLTSLILKNYSIQYERATSKSISLAVSIRTMPTTSMPFKNAIIKGIEEDDETKDVIEKLRLSNFAFTPEVRFYTGKKGYGRGFYIAPFYRYSKYKVSNLTVNYENAANQQNSIDLSGMLTSNTGGILFGAQWGLGKNLCLDWWILGPHYGSGNGTFTGVAKQPLTQDEQNDLRQELEDLDIPLTNKTVNVNAGGASLILDGPWGGLRAGLSLGIKF